MRHHIGSASWNLPLDQWPTLCGWKFAKYHVKVELAKRKPMKIPTCDRDQVSGGWSLADHVQV